MIIRYPHPSDPGYVSVFACDNCGEQTNDLTGWEGDESCEHHYCPYHKAEREAANVDESEIENT
jgi:hypothetical protein